VGGWAGCSVSVADEGVGFGGTPGAGHGIGLRGGPVADSRYGSNGTGRRLRVGWVGADRVAGGSGRRPVAVSVM
jgi:hypothetical protein